MAGNAIAGQFGKRQRLIEMFGPPGKQPFGKLQPDRQIGRIGSDIG